MKRIALLTAILMMAWVSVCHSQMNSGGASSAPSSSGSSSGVSSGSSGAGSASGDFGATSNPSSSSGSSMGAGSAGSSSRSSDAALGAADSSSAAQDFSSSGSIKISRMGEKAPAGMNALAQGEIVNIDRTANKVTIRDSRTGSSVRYTINDQKELKDLNQGDRVQVFSDANQVK